MARIRAEVFSAPQEDDTQLRALEAERDGILKRVQELRSGAQVENMALYGQLAQLESGIREAMADLARQEQNERAQARMDELQREQETLAEEIKHLEELQRLAEAFTRRKVELIQE